ncbi:unnamed protein product [Dracunculus medinensis]|uniref:G_PROTEIN_RECEP_F1_2 domain-containing protein n=1 Tax=Dracunculus medinensis TaxID=318479 RepID=A0A0N4U3H1_DRAME|nr:unnamed protein product [Dracunculus medinensis]
MYFQHQLMYADSKLINKEWQLGAVGCKLSTWINSTTSCASIFTLVAVTADRYLAICHTMKYAIWDAKWTLFLIVGIWITSGVLAAPTFAVYDEVLFALDPPNKTMVARLCVSTQDETINFIVINLFLAFVVPFALISVFYTRIFITVSNHQSLAVDASIRDERVKLRVAQMMLTVIIVFALCWIPLYGIYCYFFFSIDHTTPAFQFASQVLRPIFQWLSLLSSSLNPLIYIAYSRKYRRAFQDLLLLPCKTRYEHIRSFTRSKLRLSSLNRSSDKTVDHQQADIQPMCFCDLQLKSDPKNDAGTNFWNLHHKLTSI